MSDANRKASERARKRAAGLKPIEVWVHESDIPVVRELEKRLARLRASLKLTSRQ